MPIQTAAIDWSPPLQAILGSDPASQTYGEVSLWFHKLQMFRKGEDERIFKGSPTPDDIEIHKRLSLRLIADGEHLLRVIGEGSGLIDNPENIRAADLSAALEGLRDSYRGLHNTLAPERREEVLRGVFGDVA